jgi:hypothetical protein
MQEDSIVLVSLNIIWLLDELDWRVGCELLFFAQI